MDRLLFEYIVFTARRLGEEDPWILSTTDVSYMKHSVSSRSYWVRHSLGMLPPMHPMGPVQRASRGREIVRGDAERDVIDTPPSSEEPVGGMIDVPDQDSVDEDESASL